MHFIEKSISKNMINLSDFLYIYLQIKFGKETILEIHGIPYQNFKEIQSENSTRIIIEKSYSKRVDRAKFNVFTFEHL